MMEQKGKERLPGRLPSSGLAASSPTINRPNISLSPPDSPSSSSSSSSSSKPPASLGSSSGNAAADASEGGRPGCADLEERLGAPALLKAAAGSEVLLTFPRDDLALERTPRARRTVRSALDPSVPPFLF
jgi:hypothetical protein